jgi:hypothetical protein
MKSTKLIKKNKQNIDMEDIKGEVCLLGNLISPKF